MAEIVSFEATSAITTPAAAIIVPEVTIVGKALFSASVMASFGSICRRDSRYRSEITMA